MKLAATRIRYGSDVDFGSLTRHLVASLQQRDQFELLLSHEVSDLEQQRNGRWLVTLKDRRSGQSKVVNAGFVFLGAGGGALPLLQKSGIPGKQRLRWFPGLRPVAGV